MTRDFTRQTLEALGVGQDVDLDDPTTDDGERQQRLAVGVGPVVGDHHRLGQTVPQQLLGPNISAVKSLTTDRPDGT
jgi:hypothetical protein